MVSASAHGMNILGIDIGGTKTSVCLGDERGRVGASRRMASETSAGPDAWLGRVKAMVDAFLREQRIAHRDLAAVGVAAPGPLSVSRGVLLDPPNMIGWHDVPVTAMLRDLFSAPVSMNNDANACALAEFLYGSCKGVPDLVYLTMSTGLGAGVITGGRLLQGATDLGGEVGHHVLHAAGPACPCWQRGCWELMCGGLNVANRLREQVVSGRVRTAILDEAGGDPARIDFRTFVAAVRKGDAFARSAWEEYVEALAHGVGTVIMFFNPSVVMLGTIAIHAGDLLLDPLRARVSKYAWRPAVEACRIIPSTLGERIGDLSALAVAADAMSRQGARGSA